MRILFVAGGTAGPLTPLLATAEELHRTLPNAEAHFLLSSSSEAQRKLVQAAGFSSSEFSSGKLRRYFTPRNVIDVFKTLGALFQARKLLRAQRPDCVVTAGSFNGVPLSIAAWSLRIPVLVHQQDVQPGLANRFAAPFAQKITVTFPESAQYFSSRKTLVTGNPVRSSVLHGNAEAARSRFRLPTDRPLVVVLGGSSGAAFINALVAESKEALHDICTIVHITGREHEAHGVQSDRYFPMSFLGEGMGDLLAAADVVVTRAGLGTLSELAALGKVTLIIPMPDTHQDSNARYFARHKAAVAVPQDVLSPVHFHHMLTTLLANRDRREELERNIRALAKPDAAATIVDVIKTLVAV